MKKTSTKLQLQAGSFEIGAPTITPLELARLTAQLVSAGLITRKNDAPHVIIADALKFLKACEETPHNLKRREQWLAADLRREERIRRLTAGIPAGGKVPLALLLECAQVHRLTLNEGYLKGLGIKTEWVNLPEEERAAALLRVLAAEPAQYDGEFPLPDGRIVRHKGSCNIMRADVNRIITEGEDLELVPGRVQFLELAGENFKTARNRLSGTKPKGKKKTLVRRGADGQVVTEAASHRSDGTIKPRVQRGRRKDRE